MLDLKMSSFYINGSFNLVFRQCITAVESIAVADLAVGVSGAKVRFYHILAVQSLHFSFLLWTGNAGSKSVGSGHLVLTGRVPWPSDWHQVGAY